MAVVVVVGSGVVVFSVIDKEGKDTALNYQTFNNNFFYKSVCLKF